MSEIRLSLRTEPPLTHTLQVLSVNNGRVGPPISSSSYLSYSDTVSSTDLPFYQRHPKYTGAALGVTGTVLLAPVAVVGFLSLVGFTSAGVAAGDLIPPST